MTDLANWLKSEGEPASRSDRRLANRFLCYWEQLRGRQPFPLITDISFDDIREFSPHIFNIELSAGFGDPVIRFVGKDIEALCGGDLANRTLRELPPQSLLARAMAHADEVVADGKPITFSDEFLDAQGRAVLFRAVMLPFSNDGEEITCIFGAMNSKTIAGATESLRQPPPAVSAPEARREVAEVLADLEQSLAEDAGEGPGEGPQAVGKGHVIVLGSAKGGTGKTTAAMHLITALLYSGKTVASIDFDTPQRSLSRYIENREAFNRARGLALPTSLHLAPTLGAYEAVDIEQEIARLLVAHDYLVIDTPGSDSGISRMAHTWADTLITPLNDSFVDLDTLAVVEAGSRSFARRGPYADLVLRAQRQRAAQSGRTPDWIVLRNRLSPLGARNKDRMAKSLADLAERLGFHNAAGLSERVIYRELFLAGLTLLDLREETIGIPAATSHLAARNELQGLLDLVLEASAKAVAAN